MEDNISGHSNMTIKEVCACYAAAIYLANRNSEFIKFGNDAKMMHYNRLDDVFHIIRKMQQNDECGYGTDIAPVWQMLDKHYERIFLFSDMQVMNNYGGSWYWGYSKTSDSISLMNDYMRRYGRTHVYSFDLGNYSTQISNPKRGDLTMFTALTDKVFTFISLMEQGQNIVDYINEHYANIC